MLEESSISTFSRKSYFLIAQNENFRKVTKRSLFEHFLLISAKYYENGFLSGAENYDKKKFEEFKLNFFLVILSLLEEMADIDSVRCAIPIEKLLSYTNNDNYCSEIDESFTNCKINFTHTRYFIDDLLANIVAYWKKSDDHYKTYKERLKLLSPFFIMVFNVIEGEDKYFIEKFLENLEILQTSFTTRYGGNSFNEHYTSSYLFVLLLSAIKNERETIIDHILNYEAFANVKMQFAPNMASKETCQYLVLKLLQHGHEIGKKEIPSNWISPKNFEEYLDSCVKYL